VKPLSLKISGFRSHLEPTELSFAGRTLTAIVGPTGAGKSSILEAISYALYGKTPREQRAVKRLICSRGETARVEFNFLIDEREFKVTRVLRRTGAGQHIIEDLSSGEKVVGETAVSIHVADLLGLGFDAFSSSVLLAQGQFSKFLEATPKDRGVILKGIFRLDQIDELQQAAKARRDALEGDLKLIEGERNAIPAEVAVLLKEARARETQATARAAALEKAIPRERDLLRVLSDAERQRGEYEASIERIKTMTGRLPKDRELQDLATEEKELRELQELAGDALEVAEEALAVAVSQSLGLEKELGSEADLLDARAHIRARDTATKDIERLTKQRITEAENREAAGLAASMAERVLAEASAEVRAVREQQNALQRTHAAHALRVGLVPGEPCPVCEQTVRTIPGGEPPGELVEIALREKAAIKTEAQAATEARESAMRVAGLEAALVASADSLAALEEARQARERELAEAFGSSITSAAEVEARLVRIRASRTLVEAARATVTAERARVDKISREAKTFGSRFLDKTRNLIELSAQVELPAPAADAPAASLAAHAAKVRDRLASQLQEIQVELASTRSSAMVTAGELEHLRADLDLTRESVIESVFADARAAAGVARNEAATAEKQLARSKELNKEEKAVKARQALFRTLATDLTAQQFIAFLLEDRTRLLLELGSERLHTMTGNRYRLELDDKNELEVVDELDADKRRSVDTLSGGETFLASLALAIALAEVVTRAGGRLQCFFLDEGFGTLDPESFDLAMDGIERIVSPDRLIGLVSHVPALRDRIEDQIMLEKGDDGMSRVASGQAL
jgi:DNA repair protein SbcC/Rad50